MSPARKRLAPPDAAASTFARRRADENRGSSPPTAPPPRRSLHPSPRLPATPTPAAPRIGAPAREPLRRVRRECGFPALLLVYDFDRVEARGHPRRIEPGKHRDTPHQHKRACQETHWGMKLDGPAEALIIDYEYQ